MSNTGVEALLNDMIKEFHAAGGDEDKKGSARRQAYKQPGQLFVVNRSRLEQGLNAMSKELSLKKLSKDKMDEIWAGYDKYLLGQEKNIKDENRKRILHLAKAELLLSKKYISKGGTVYLVNKFETMKSSKREEISRLVAEAYKKDSAYDEAKHTKMKTFIGGGKDAKGKADQWLGFNIGHGEYGDPSLAVGGARVQQKFKQGEAAAKLTPDEQTDLNQLFIEYSDALNIKLDHTKILDANGELDINYVMTISLQDKASNIADTAAERKASTALLAGLKKNLKTHAGSWNLIEGIERVLLHAMTRRTKRTKGVKVVIKGARPASRLQSSSSAGPKKEQIKVGTYVTVAVSKQEISKKVAAKTASKQKARKRVPTKSPLALLALLNKKLPQTVVDNMGAPALENRTGRFASSVRAVNVIQGKSSPTFQYTYQRNPYQRFEGTEPWADGGNRDPRKLIERSIREIAAELAIGRFYTQRI